MKSKFSDKERPVILIADDDEEDRMMAEEALEECKMPSRLEFVKDGVEALDYLYNRGKFADVKKYPRPRLVLLDLNMPKKDGRDVLKEIKQTEALRKIPVVILTTSNSEEDIATMYKGGVNSYITKPVSFKGMVDAMTNIKNYWFDTVSLPSE